ncbi:MAG: MFS transporter [Pseudomonadales bacterium]|nr:MFS transporter [Pseudomonadales bacterium]
MDALLILGGLLLIVFGLVWLVTLAFGSSLFWGLGSLFPPLTLLYVVRHWRIARKAVVLGSLGFIPLVVGLVLLANHDPERLQAILSLRWLEPAEQAPKELAIDLRGQLHGEAFAPQQAELIDGVLSLREGEDFFARREVNIRLPRVPTGELRLDILPGDNGPLPEIEISWLQPEQDLPEARRLSQGYTLHLNLQPLAPNKMAGEFHLILPPQYQTALSGKLELFTDRLRYREGKVDTRFDSRDTLVYVLEDYLQRRYVSRNVSVRQLPTLNLPAQQVDVQIEAVVDGQVQPLALTLSKSPSRGWMVQGDYYERLPASLTAPVAQIATKPVEAPRSRSTLDRRLRFSLERLLRAPDQYLNLRMRALTEKGRAAEGQFAGINADGRIVIRRELSGPGEASYILRPAEITQIELLEP